MAGGTRDGNGRFIRTLDGRRRDHEAAVLRAKGRTFQQIADELGYAHRGKAEEGVQRAYAEIPSEGSADAKALDLYRIDMLIAWHWDLIERPHVAVSHGKIMTRQVGVERDDDGIERLDMDGKPIPVHEDILDDGPAQASARELRALLKRRAEAIGYDAPARSRVEVITHDAFSAALADMEAKVAANDADRGVSGRAAPVRGAPGKAAPAGG